MMPVDIYKENQNLTDGLTSIIAQLEHQKTAIEKALAALRDVEGTVDEGPTVSTPATRKGGMSPEGKKRLIKALKKRWAAKKAGAQAAEAPVTVAETPRKPIFTPEGRKKLAEAMKRRWAVKRAASAVKKTATKKRKAGIAASLPSSI
jgi:hypothetical protein